SSASIPTVATHSCSSTRSDSPKTSAVSSRRPFPSHDSGDATPVSAVPRPTLEKGVPTMTFEAGKYNATAWLAAAVALTFAMSSAVTAATTKKQETQVKTSTAQLEAAQPTGAAAVRPFRVNVPDHALTDLRRRIADTRWPDKETVNDRSQGAQLEQF